MLFKAAIRVLVAGNKARKNDLILISGLASFTCVTLRVWCGGAGIDNDSHLLTQISSMAGVEACVCVPQWCVVCGCVCGCVGVSLCAFVLYTRRPRL